MDISIFDLAVRAKNGESTAFESLMEYFGPMIKNYSKLLKGADMEQELLIYLWELLHRLPLQSNDLRNNKIIFSYIAKSLKHHYIRISRNYAKITKAEMVLKSEFALADPRNFETKTHLLDMSKELSPNELNILVWIYAQGYSVKEVATVLRVTRQSVNQLKCRALKKLKFIYSKG